MCGLFFSFLYPFPILSPVSPTFLRYYHPSLPLHYSLLSFCIRKSPHFHNFQHVEETIRFIKKVKKNLCESPLGMWYVLNLSVHQFTPSQSHTYGVGANITHWKLRVRELKESVQNRTAKGGSETPSHQKLCSVSDVSPEARVHFKRSCVPEEFRSGRLNGKKLGG